MVVVVVVVVVVAFSEVVDACSEVVFSETTFAVEVVGTVVAAAVAEAFVAADVVNAVVAAAVAEVIAAADVVKAVVVATLLEVDAAVDVVKAVVTAAFVEVVAVVDVVSAVVVTAISVADTFNVVSASFSAAVTVSFAGLSAAKTANAFILLSERNASAEIKAAVFRRVSFFEFIITIHPFWKSYRIFLFLFSTEADIAHNRAAKQHHQGDDADCFPVRSIFRRFLYCRCIGGR